MNTLLRIDKLEKTYGDKKAVSGISFAVHKGEILCVLGPNGAGKSTTMNILTGSLGYNAGSIAWKGKDIDKALRAFKYRLGIVPQDLALYEDLSAWQNVCFFASLYGLKGEKLKAQCKTALEFAGLYDRSGDKVKIFSGGMKRRLNIACAIAHNPEILIMDEPTVGIDPQSRNHILRSIKKLRDNGMTIIYTTHYMEEVEEISTRIIVMDQGEIIAEGTKEALKESIEQDKLFTIELENADELQADEFYHIEGVKKVCLTKEKIEIATLSAIENLDRIISLLIEHAVRIKGITCHTISLETVFLKLTGKSLRD